MEIQGFRKARISMGSLSLYLGERLKGYWLYFIFQALFQKSGIPG